jgi:predicted RNA-binding Zn-ribbon protein involved in translation (DUF1610 family)
MRASLVIREMLRKASVFDILDNLVERTDMTLYLKLKCPHCGYEQFVDAAMYRQNMIISGHPYTCGCGDHVVLEVSND